LCLPENRRVLKEPAVVTISYDEKPGIQALATTPQSPCRPAAKPAFASCWTTTQRIHLYFEPIHAEPVIFRWKYKMYV
jgi:hypothetical protein